MKRLEADLARDASLGKLAFSKCSSSVDVEQLAIAGVVHPKSGDIGYAILLFYQTFPIIVPGKHNDRVFSLIGVIHYFDSATDNLVRAVFSRDCAAYKHSLHGITDSIKPT